jgi:hypothetical protein
MARTVALAVTLATSLTVACMTWAGYAAAASFRPTAVAPAATEQAEEAAEAHEEAAEVSAEVAPAFQPKTTSKPSASTSRRIGRLTRQIHHLRVVKERIRAKRRHLRGLPVGSKRRQHGLAVQTAKLLRKRNRLFFIQNERRELEGH